VTGAPLARRGGTLASSGPLRSKAMPADTATEIAAPVVAPETTAPATTAPATTPVDTDHGDHDRFAHYCKKADITRALVTGEAIVALCGKKWVPSRDPSRYPVCPTCRERKAAGWTL
jgi:Protein of unknown function (DUF3039)